MRVNILNRSWRGDGSAIAKLLAQGGVAFESISAAECGKIANDNFPLRTLIAS